MGKTKKIDFAPLFKDAENTVAYWKERYKLEREENKKLRETVDGLELKLYGENPP